MAKQRGNGSVSISPYKDGWRLKWKMPDGSRKSKVIGKMSETAALRQLNEIIIDVARGDYLGTSTAEGTEIMISGASAADAPLFTTATGKRWAASEAFRTVQRLALAAGIDGRVSPHSLRHTHATLALDAGATLHDLQDSMGHADPRTTRPL
ncbi:tyrosine-type recombinase/integrase [Microbacterium sp.]|uniref:tyrosine-type recombinase/integrase n=1 Tax=Microbacterium sp. TaxID=51671 RepID=UPI0039E24250